jgi:hypothetical protein
MEGSSIEERTRPTGYKVVWMSLETNLRGESQEPMSYYIAKAWRDQMNVKYKGELHHWIEPWVEVEPEPTSEA